MLRTAKSLDERLHILQRLRKSGLEASFIDAASALIASPTRTSPYRSTLRPHAQSGLRIQDIRLPSELAVTWEGRGGGGGGNTLSPGAKDRPVVGSSGSGGGGGSVGGERAGSGNGVPVQDGGRGGGYGSVEGEVHGSLHRERERAREREREGERERNEHAHVGASSHTPIDTHTGILTDTHRDRERETGARGLGAIDNGQVGGRARGGMIPNGKGGRGEGVGSEDAAGGGRGGWGLGEGGGLEMDVKKDLPVVLAEVEERKELVQRRLTALDMLTRLKAPPPSAYKVIFFLL
jgi:hypothetical protein